MKLSFILLLASLPSFAIPTFEATYETTPIPMGIETTDDAAIYLDENNPSKSVILGVSKNKEEDGGRAGLAVYDLTGKELQFFQHDRINNVDLRIIDGKAMAIGSNRDKKAISLFEVKNQKVELLTDIKIEKYMDAKEEPYGICAYARHDKLYAILPMKSGLIYIFRIYKNGKIALKHEKTINLANYVGAKLDRHLTDITIDDVVYEGERTPGELALKIKEEISERFQLEGCAVADKDKTLYVGMEQLGVFKINLDDKDGELILQAEYSKEKVRVENIDTRFTNDIEGLDIYTAPSGREYLIVSIQGISEYAILDRKTEYYIGSFKVNFGDDKVTETDGLAVHSGNFGSEFPVGMLVLHDHHNTDGPELKNGNYKIVNMLPIVEQFNL